jgi:hypothetical protein
MRLTIRQTFFLILFIGIFIMTLRPVADPDFWWHLRTGELIANTGNIPNADPFSFTNLGKAWVTHEWLTELSIFGLFQLGGYALLIVTFSIIITISFLLAYLTCSKASHPYAAGFAVLLGALASAPTWGVRPQMLSLLLTALFLFLLDRYQQTRKLKHLILLPFMIILWVNLHAGYFLGFGIIGIFILSELIHLARAALRKEKLDYRAVSALGIVLVLSILAALANPNTYHILLYPFETLTSNSMMQFIQEWFSPDFHQTQWLPLAVLFLTLIALPLLVRRPVSWTHILLVVIFGYAALRSMRHVPLFALVAIPVLAEQLASFMGTRTQKQPPTRLTRILNPLLVGFVILAAGLRTVSVVLEQPASEAETTPKAAVDWILQKHPEGKIYNTYSWGGYLIWRLYPEYLVYIDGRADVYGDEFIYDYMDIYRVRPGWETALDARQVNTVLLQRNEPLANALLQSPGWKLAFEDEKSIIFTRK